MTSLLADDLDAIIFPGGFGAAKNLCSFASKGADAELLSDVKDLVIAMYEAGKPIGAMCIAPAVIALAFRGSGVRPRLTIGSDASTAQALETLGAHHEPCGPDGIVVDKANRIVTTPAYMLAGRISEAAPGIERLVAEVVRMTGH